MRRSASLPHRVVEVRGKTLLRAFALAWMYVYRQQSVPFFRVADGGMAAMRLRFEGSLTPAGERAMYASLIDALGEDAGYTRIAEREIVVIDFARHAGFAQGVREFAKHNRIVQVERLAVRAKYRSHDWQADRDGKTLLAEVRRLAPQRDVEPALRAMHARYEALVADWLARLAACCRSRSTPQQFASSGR